MKRRGFTLLEMMVVVAIVGVMSALAAGGIQNLMALGRVNGSSLSVSRMMANGRMRAIGMSCRVSVQINGPTYTPPAVAGFPMNAGSVYVFQKGNCAAPSTNGGFEPPPALPALPDRVIAELTMAEQRTITTVPVALVGAGVLNNDAITVSWGVDSDGIFKRDTYADVGGTGTFTKVDIAGDIPILFTINNNPATRSAIIPQTGAAYVEY